MAATARKTRSGKPAPSAAANDAATTASAANGSTDLLPAGLDPEFTIEPQFRPEHFINRELGWLEFNARVLEEAEDPTNPLLERAKFLSIFSSNQDEFFMVRVAGLREQAFGESAPQDFAPDGMSPQQQLDAISQRAHDLVSRQYAAWNNEVRPALAAAGIRIFKFKELGKLQKAAVETFFRGRAFPVLTPMAVDPLHPRPRYHNRGLYLAAMLHRQTGLGPRKLFGVVQVPQVLPRLVRVSNDEPHFIFLEDLLQAKLTELFGGFEVLSSTCFRVTRDSDIEMLEQESDDLLKLIEERLRARARGDAVRLEISAEGDETLIRGIISAEELREGSRTSPYDEVYRVPGPLDLTSLTELLKVPGFDQLRDAPFTPKPLSPPERRSKEDMFSAIRRNDILLHHPYDSFSPVVEFIFAAADDPNVLAIKQTLYRTSYDSPVTRALMKAAENKKHVTALVELKARFDEEANVGWARQMERSGVHVVYGFLDMKTHCKVALVVRQEGERLRRYVHLGTGNYNPQTATVYTDLGLFTCNDEVGEDASALFNLLTGYSQGNPWHKLIVAPEHLLERTLELIDEQARRAKQGWPSWIFAKINAISDHRVIQALYRASQAGVPIDLVVRGVCGLRPGLPGLSETIRVRSIVDRFLEHSRIFVFNPPEHGPQVYLASADWMPRNLNRRVEVMVPIEREELKQRVLCEIIPCFLRDNARARELRADGTYTRVPRKPGDSLHRSQFELLGLSPPQATALSPAAQEERELSAKEAAIAASGQSGRGENGKPRRGSPR